MLCLNDVGNLRGSVYPEAAAGIIRKSQPMGGPLLASHGIISHVRWTFASECSLLCVPNLFNKILMLVNPLP